MSAQCEVTAKAAAGAPLSLFERWLTLWSSLLVEASRWGSLLPAPFQALARMEVANVNLPVGLLIWGYHPDADQGRFRRAARVKSHVKASASPCSSTGW